MAREHVDQQGLEIEGTSDDAELPRLCPTVVEDVVDGADQIERRLFARGEGAATLSVQTSGVEQLQASDDHRDRSAQLVAHRSQERLEHPLGAPRLVAQAPDHPVRARLHLLFAEPEHLRDRLQARAPAGGAGGCVRANPESRQGLEELRIEVPGSRGHATSCDSSRLAMRRYSVARPMPSILAALLTLPWVTLSACWIALRSSSRKGTTSSSGNSSAQRPPPGRSGAGGSAGRTPQRMSAGRSESFTTSLEQARRLRCTTFSSSRTFPGHE